MTNTVRASIVVEGKVQGVFFRASALEEAQRLGLKGFVRNLPDGRVEAVAEGPQSQVDAFIEWCHLGPSAAKVERVESRRSDPREDEFRTFTIER